MKTIKAWAVIWKDGEFYRAFPTMETAREFKNIHNNKFKVVKVEITIKD